MIKHKCKHRKNIQRKTEKYTMACFVCKTPTKKAYRGILNVRHLNCDTSKVVTNKERCQRRFKRNKLQEIINEAEQK